MIKKLVGLIVAVASIVVIVISALHGEKYTSMLSRGRSAAPVEQTDAAAVAPDLKFPKAPMAADTTVLYGVDSLVQDDV